MVRNKTIIGLKSKFIKINSKTKDVRNKTIIGLKYTTITTFQN